MHSAWTKQSAILPNPEASAQPSFIDEPQIEPIPQLVQPAFCRKRFQMGASRSKYPFIAQSARLLRQSKFDEWLWRYFSLDYAR